MLVAPRLCAVEPEWVLERAETGILGEPPQPQQQSAPPPEPAPPSSGWRFSSLDLVRARRMRDIECTFDADEHLAALVWTCRKKSGACGRGCARPGSAEGRRVPAGLRPARRP